MTERKFKKLVREHPYLLDDTFTISRSEAKKIYKQGFPSAEELLEGAKRKYADLPPEGWKRFDDVLAEQKAKKQKRRIGRLDLNKVFCIVNRHRRLAIACLILTLALSFFTLVPAGRALAAEIIRFFVKVFENRIEVTVENSNKDALMEQGYLEAATHTDLGNIGIEPFVLDVDWLMIDSIIYEFDGTGKTIFTNYSTYDCMKLNTVQQWDVDASFSISANINNYDEVHLSDNFTMYVSADQDDGIIDGILIRLNDYILISTNSEILFNNLVDALKE